MSKYTNYGINSDDRSSLHEVSNPDVIVSIQGSNNRNISVSVNQPHLRSLSISRKAGDTANSFKLEVLDTLANDLEYNLLASGSGNIEIKYKTSVNDNLMTKNAKANADGFVTLNNSYTEFSGMITKMSSSWINNRNMLTLEGIVGISIQDMYDKYSFNWNKVPKFDWSSVFSDYKASGWSADRNEDDNWWEQFKDWWNTNIWNTTTLSLRWNIGGAMFSGDLQSKANSVYAVLQSGVSHGGEEGAKQKLQLLMDNMKVDAAGNFYIRRDQYSNNMANSDEDDKDSWVKQSGDYIVPMRPSNLCSFICQGGDFEDLLYEDENFEEYKDTSFYNGDNRVSVLDWWWIQLWYKKMGHFDGMGLSIGDFDSTDLVEEDLTQSAQSITNYIEETLIPVSKETVEVKKKKTETSKDGKYEVKISDIVQYVYANYMFSVDDNGVANYKRFSATEKYKEEPETTYYYYSSFDGDMDIPHNADGHGILQSFSAKLDVLTSMITNGSSSGGDISNINLVYGGKLKDTKVEVDPNEDGNLQEFDGWGKLTTYSQKAVGTDTEITIDYTETSAYASTLAYEADATIIGSCGLKPLDLIRINVVQGISRIEGNSYRHHTSGLYLVQTIEETIVSGKIISKLHLIKNANSVGDTAARGIVSELHDKTYFIKKKVYGGDLSVNSNEERSVSKYFGPDYYDEDNWNNGVPADPKTLDDDHLEIETYNVM